MKKDTRRADVFARRAIVVGLAQMGVLGALAARLYKLQVVDGGRYAVQADSNRLSTRMLAPPRGRILDRAGTVLAGNKLNWRALLIAEEAADPMQSLDRFAMLVPIADRERARIERDLKHQHSFIPTLVKDFLTWEEMAKIQVNIPDLPGIVVDMGTKREYPLGPLTAHVVGYVAPPNERDVRGDSMLALPGIRVGRAGIEQTQEQSLRGRAGGLQLEVNAVGRVIREVDRIEGVPGADVTLTVDAGLQSATMRLLGDESASAVVMDVRNGEVLAMATNPSFDPSLFNSGVSQAQWLQWTNDRKAPLINKAIAGVYPPGSTFKMAVALAALEGGTLTASDRIECPGYMDLGNIRFHCWRRGGHGSLDLRGGLKNSCDVYFYQVARRTGIDRISEMAHKLGMGVPLDIELTDVRNGLIPSRAWMQGRGKHWNLGDTVVSGIGQGYVQVTPLQLATYVSRVATGRVVEPRLVRALSGVGQVAPDAAALGSLGLDPKFLQAVRDGMIEVVNAPGGTAPQARLPLPGVQMAGKTGSSQVRRVSREQREHGFNSETLPWEYRPHALFVCYAPIDAPRYACAVVVEHGNAGAAAAAPLARDIMVETLTRDPAGPAAPGQKVASAGPRP